MSEVALVGPLSRDKALSFCRVMVLLSRLPLPRVPPRSSLFKAELAAWRGCSGVRPFARALAVSVRSSAACTKVLRAHSALPGSRRT